MDVASLAGEGVADIVEVGLDMGANLARRRHHQGLHLSHGLGCGRVGRSIGAPGSADRGRHDRLFDVARATERNTRPGRARLGRHSRTTRRTRPRTRGLVRISGRIGSWTDQAGGRKSRSWVRAGMATRARVAASMSSFARTDARVVVIGPGDHLAPRPDDGGAAPGAPTVFMQSALRRGQDEGAGFDGAGAQQDFPMGLAGRSGEGGGNRDHRRPRLGQLAMQMGKADVVADGQAQPAPGRVGDHRPVARPHRGAFAVSLAVRQIDVEDMQLVIARRDRARRVDQQRPIGRPRVPGMTGTSRWPIRPAARRPVRTPGAADPETAVS